MDRQSFHRSDILVVLRTALEAGHALANQRPDHEFLKGYASALRPVATALGLLESMSESQNPHPASGDHLTPTQPQLERAVR